MAVALLIRREVVIACRSGAQVYWCRGPNVTDAMGIEDDESNRGEIRVARLAVAPRDSILLVGPEVAEHVAPEELEQAATGDSPAKQVASWLVALAVLRSSSPSSALVVQFFSSKTLVAQPGPPITSAAPPGAGGPACCLHSTSYLTAGPSRCLHLHAPGVTPGPTRSAALTADQQHAGEASFVHAFADERTGSPTERATAFPASSQAGAPNGTSTEIAAASSCSRCPRGETGDAHGSRRGGSRSRHESCIACAVRAAGPTRLRSAGLADGDHAAHADLGCGAARPAG
jgi:hypothetical protein